MMGKGLFGGSLAPAATIESAEAMGHIRSTIARVNEMAGIAGKVLGASSELSHRSESTRREIDALIAKLRVG